MSKDLTNEYRRPEIYSNYDAKRFVSAMGRRRNRKKITAIRKALALIARPGLVIDVPCGTGRLFEFMGQDGLRFVGADVSEGMLGEASRKPEARPALGLVAADAEHLPFKDGAFDAVLCIRFLFHVPGELRVRMLREMARISKEHLVIDYRMGFSWRNFARNALSPLTRKRRVIRPSKEEAFAQMRAAGLEPLAVFAVQPFFSDKHVVLCRKNGPGPACGA